MLVAGVGLAVCTAMVIMGTSSFQVWSRAPAPRQQGYTARSGRAHGQPAGQTGRPASGVDLRWVTDDTTMVMGDG